MNKKLDSKRKKIVHVNRQFIAINSKLGDSLLPVYTIKEGKDLYYAFAVNIHGGSNLVDQRVRKPLSCGAKAWIETNGELTMIDYMSYQEALERKATYEHST